MSVSLASQNDDVPRIEDRRGVHDAELVAITERRERRNWHSVMRNRSKKSARRLAWIAFIACIVAVLIATDLVIDSLIPVPPSFTFSALREWTRSPEYRMAVGCFLLGTSVGVALLSFVLMCKHRASESGHARTVLSF